MPDCTGMKMYFSSVGCVKATGAPGHPGQSAPSPVGQARGQGPGDVQICTAGIPLVFLK